MLHDHAAFPVAYLNIASWILGAIMVGLALFLCYYLVWSLVERYALEPVLKSSLTKVANETEKENS